MMRHKHVETCGGCLFAIVGCVGATKPKLSARFVVSRFEMKPYVLFLRFLLLLSLHFPSFCQLFALIYIDACVC